MRRVVGFTVLLLLVMPVVCAAQSKEVGVAGGFGLYHDATVTARAGQAEAGFGPRRFGANYLFWRPELRSTAGSTISFP